MQCEDDKIVIKRIYLPDLTTETIDVETPRFVSLEQQENSNCIIYKGVDPVYYAKYLELKENREYADSLIDKHQLQNQYPNVKDYYLETLDNNVMRYILWYEYEIYPYSIFEYDFRTGETTITQLPNGIFFEEQPQNANGEK